MKPTAANRASLTPPVPAGSPANAPTTVRLPNGATFELTSVPADVFEGNPSGSIALGALERVVRSGDQPPQAGLYIESKGAVIYGSFFVSGNEIGARAVEGIILAISQVASASAQVAQWAITNGWNSGQRAVRNTTSTAIETAGHVGSGLVDIALWPTRTAASALGLSDSKKSG